LDVPDLLVNGMLKKAGVPGTKEMARNYPHGLLLPENRGANFLGTDRVLTSDGKVDLAPEEYTKTFQVQAEALYADELANRDRVKLVGKRELRRMNTSSANCERLVSEATNYIYMSPQDADRIGVHAGDAVEVESDHGRIVIPARITDEMMPRTVAIPQCWGHADADGLRHAQKHPGVNSNLLAGDGRENIEKLSGMSHLSGILVDLRRAAQKA
jgi:formate dehydrogenase